MKILFLGGRTAGCIGLLTLLAKGYRPDVVAYSRDVEELAEGWGISSRKSLPRYPWHDLLISVHGRQIVPKDFLDKLPLGGINLHPCLYKYKGANPIKRALEAGETKFSVGAHRMTEKVDEGEVLVEKFIEIPRTNELLYTEAEIYAKLYPLYSIVLSEALEKVIA